MTEPAQFDAVDAKTRLDTLLDRVEQGEEIVITRDGRAVAKLVRLEREPTVAERRGAIERITRLADKRTLNDVDSKTLRDMGRK